MLTYQFITIVLSILAVGATLMIAAIRITSRLDADRRVTDKRIEDYLDQAGTDRRDSAERADRYLAEAAADRRALQESTNAFRTEMTTFRTEMHRLAERQVRLEASADD